MQLVLQLIPVSAANTSYSKEETTTWTPQEKQEKSNTTPEVKSFTKQHEK